MLTILFYQKDMPVEGQRPKEIRVKYFEPLTVALDKFNEIYNHPSMKPAIYIIKVYNQYGQDIPLTYKIQKTNLELFY
jgi:hypothetical protein